jgi:gliding motility-associated-like protein
MIVTVYSQPEIAVFPIIDTICSGQSLNLLAFTADTLSWKTNYNLTCLTVACDTASVNPQVTTSYIAQSKNQYGCISTDTSFIRVYAPFTLQVLPADTSVCPKELVRYRTNVNGTTTTNGVTTWTPSTYLNSATILSPKSRADTSISYTIIVTDSAGCYADTAIATIQTYQLPTVNAGPDQIVPYNNAFILSPIYSAGISNYLWSPSLNSLSCTSCPVTTGIAAVTTTYTIVVTSSDGCKAKDNIIVSVACDKANLTIPSAFTPNNDGRNDMFYPMTRGYKVINTFIIYDRWGNKVFERHNFTPNVPSLGWNGDAKDKLTSGSAIFVWIIEATCDIGEKVSSKGTVVLIR